MQNYTVCGILCILGSFSCFVGCEVFIISFSKNSFRNTIILERQTAWFLIRTVVLFVLVCVQIVCKGYQQMTKVPASKKSVKELVYLLEPTMQSFC